MLREIETAIARRPLCSVQELALELSLSEEFVRAALAQLRRMGRLPPGVAPARDRGSRCACCLRRVCASGPALWAERGAHRPRG